MERETILALTADIVAAHASNNPIEAAAVPQLIRTVYDALGGLGAPSQAVADVRKPAVPVRASVKPDAVACLECGQKMKMLKRHLATDHALTPAQYKTRWGLNADYPLVAPSYAAKRKELAVKIGLGRKPASEKGARKSRKVPTAN